MDLDKSLLKILKDKSDSTIAVFDKKNFYACYGEDARFVSEHVLLSDAAIKKVDVGGEAILYLTMNEMVYRRVVRELLTLLRQRVEVYRAEESKWIIDKKGTIGNMGDFEEELSESKTGGSLVMAIHLTTSTENVVTAVLIDSDTLSTTACEISDNELFTQTEQCVVGLSPRQCLVIGAVAAPTRGKRLRALLKKLEVHQEEEKQCPGADYWCTASKMFKKTVDVSHLSTATKLCLCALHKYIKVSDDADYYTLIDYRNSGHMRIDAAAVKALELFQSSYYQDIHNPKGTLFHTMNKCRTGAGQRLLRDWLARPLCDLRRLTERHDVVDALIGDASTRRLLHDTLLPRVPDCSQISRRLLTRKAKLQDCYRTFQLVVLLGKMYKVTKQFYTDADERVKASVRDNIFEPIYHGVMQFQRFGELIRNTIDEEYFEKHRRHRVLPSVDPELLKISNEIDEIEQLCEKAHKKIMARLDVESIKLDCNNIYGYFYRVTLKDEKRVRDAKGITTVATTKGSGYLFRDSTLEELNERFEQVNSSYEIAQQQLEENIVNICAGYAPALTQLSLSLATVDVFVSLAELAATSTHGYVRPQLEEMGSGVLEFKRARHAVLENIVEQYIPNDVHFGDNRLLVLTGANMGGKSTYLRTAALCVLMAQIGSFVPCSSAHFSLVDAIFTRVGAHDNQSKGISTFMAEMQDCSTILKTATANSLVIIDELGRGTSTFDGFGLAWGIASAILEDIRCFCLFATHFHEIGQMASKEKVVALEMRVSAEEGAVIFLYEVSEGVAKCSFGVEVAQIVGLPTNVIQAASRELQELERREYDYKTYVEKLKQAVLCGPDQLQAAIAAL